MDAGEPVTVVRPTDRIESEQTRGMTREQAIAVPGMWAGLVRMGVAVEGGPGLAMGTQIGFAVSGGLTPIVASAVAGAEGTNWLAVAVVVSIACLISGAAALTAKETKDLSLDGIDELHTTRTEAAELARLDRPTSPAGTAR